MKRVLMISVYGDKNIGDAAILDSAIKTIEESLNEKLEITIMTITPHATTINVDFKSKLDFIISPYGYAISSTNKKPVSEVRKIKKVIALSFAITNQILFGSSRSSKSYATIIVKQFENADLIFSVGGGYIRTKHPLKDLFGLYLTMLPIWIAKLYKKKVLFLPISFGNFANAVHKNIAVLSLRNERIILRDHVSKKEFSSAWLSRTIQPKVLPDMALYNAYSTNKKNQKESKYVVLTAREWLSYKKQLQYERSLSQFISYLWDRHKIRSIFLPMTWNSIEDDDNRVAKRIRSHLRNPNYFSIAKVRNPKEVQNILSGAKAAICTRMHSSILATTVGTPFISIAYEHKTHGFLKLLSLESWNIDIDKVTFELLKDKYEKLMRNNSKSFKTTLKRSYEEILKQKLLVKEEIKDFAYKNG